MEETSWPDETFCFLPVLLRLPLAPPGIPPLAPFPLLKSPWRAACLHHLHKHAVSDNQIIRLQSGPAQKVINKENEAMKWTNPKAEALKVGIKSRGLPCTHHPSRAHFIRIPLVVGIGAFAVGRSGSRTGERVHGVMRGRVECVDIPLEHILKELLQLLKALLSIFLSISQSRHYNHHQYCYQYLQCPDKIETEAYIGLGLAHHNRHLIQKIPHSLHIEFSSSQVVALYNSIN